MLRSSSMMVSASRSSAPPRSPSMSQTRKQSRDRSRRASGSGAGSSSTSSEGAATSSASSTSSTATTTTTTSCTSTAASTCGSGTCTTTTHTSTTASTTTRSQASSPSPFTSNASSHPPPRTSSSSSNTSASNASSSSSRTSSSNTNNHRGSLTPTTTHLSAFTPISAHKKTSAPAETRLVVLGSPAVGKSALVVRLLTGRFIWEYDPTLEAAYRHHTTVDDDPAVMDILDTAGQSEGGVNESHCRWGEGFVLTFSLTDRTSFSAIPDIHASVAAARQTPNFSCVIVANKIDLGHLAEVREEEAYELAGELGASLFLTSACDGGPAIQAAFSELYRDVVRRRWSRRRRSSAKTVIEGFYKMFSR
ncbi:ras-related and estrogen-regulated growth inhibitor-like [Penaeus japonicus]|uniref:ras-related and estrogen-regulated growth inhibitor-like n=1 Tax=Penaeus japonicus TaxID=27405 RepID=UPI001C70FCD5|nr:ras-related and estrogen-regulated growth inhibitor-like [Penaeus japonicus]